MHQVQHGVGGHSGRILAGVGDGHLLQSEALIELGVGNLPLLG